MFKAKDNKSKQKKMKNEKRKKKISKTYLVYRQPSAFFLKSLNSDGILNRKLLSMIYIKKHIKLIFNISTISVLQKPHHFKYNKRITELLSL